MKKEEILDQTGLARFNLVGNVTVNNLGSIVVDKLGYISDKDYLQYRYFEAKPLKLEIETKAMRSQFEAKLLRGITDRKHDIPADLLAALYGESNNWHFVTCSWTSSFVIFYLANRERLMQHYPTDDSLHTTDFITGLWLDYEGGFVELCIPVYSLLTEATKALEFTIKVATETGEYQSFQSFIFAKNALIEARPTSNANSKELDLFRLSYIAQKQLKHIEIEGEEKSKNWRSWLDATE